MSAVIFYMMATVAGLAVAGIAGDLIGIALGLIDPWDFK